MAGRDKYFKHRWDYALRDGASHRRYLIELIDELLEIEASTHPSEGPCPEKNELSKDAFMVAGRLLERSIGWAIDHRIGLALDGVPSDALEVSDHIHESKAGDYGAMDDEFQIDRRVLRSLLSALSYVIPTKLNGQVQPALRSLEIGEPSEFFDPMVRVRSIRYRLWMLRLEALEHLEFSRGMNVKRDDAKANVADAYGIAPDTLDKWSTKLNQELLGISHAEEAKGHARNRGKAAFEQLQSGDNTSATEEAEALRRDGAAFQQLIGTPEGKIIQFPE
jgi:hypothetical protein